MNRNQLKYLVIIAMLIDHIAWVFIPMASVLGQIMHFIGRLTAPTMVYFISEGYYYTHNIKKYALRLGVSLGFLLYILNLEHCQFIILMDIYLSIQQLVLSILFF